MKPVLSGVDEIISYLISLDDQMDEDFLRDYFSEYGRLVKVEAHLKSVSVHDLVMGPAENNQISNSKQKDYDKRSSEPPPILIEEDYQVLDGHHRIRSAKKQKKSHVLAYVLIFS